MTVICADCEEIPLSYTTVRGRDVCFPCARTRCLVELSALKAEYGIVFDEVTR